MACSPTAKTVAQKSFDVNNTTKIKKPVSNDCSSLSKHDLNVVYSIRAGMYQHCMNLDTKIISRHAFLRKSASLPKAIKKVVF